MTPLEELYRYCVNRKMNGMNVVSVDYVIRMLSAHDLNVATRTQKGDTGVKTVG